MQAARVINAQVQASTYKKPDLTTEDEEVILLAKELGFDLSFLLKETKTAKYKV